MVSVLWDHTEFENFTVWFFVFLVPLHLCFYGFTLSIYLLQSAFIQLICLNARVFFLLQYADFLTVNICSLGAITKVNNFDMSRLFCEWNLILIKNFSFCNWCVLRNYEINWKKKSCSLKVNYSKDEGNGMTEHSKEVPKSWY